MLDRNPGHTLHLDLTPKRHGGGLCVDRTVDHRFGNLGGMLLP
jgi:hypothetical protein